jgi:primosomal protein N' (replication factor Y)
MSEQYAEVVFNLPVEGPFTYLCPEGQELSPGMRVEAPFRGKLLTGYTVAVGSSPPEGGFRIRRLKRSLDELPLFDERHLALARWVARMYFCTTGEALSAMVPGGKREREGDFFPAEEGSFAPPEELSPAQNEALRRIRTGRERLYYLFGVTGSGKTEVFLRIAGEEISAGRGVIYLVPEISLTHQLLQQVKARFGNQVAIWHSKLSPSQKLGEWRKIRSGEVHMVIGARSAVFSPFEKLGLIILDEEHESSYKSSSTPRYHARQVAMKRCAEENARLLMGSATPSLEAYHLMKEGKIVRLDLPERVSGGPMPEVKTVSMNGAGGSISPLLQEEIRTTARMGKQTILFLNRRGFSYFFHCRSCGYEMKCKYCSVNMTYHKSTGKMVCHYCGYARDPVTVCPECGSLDVGYYGFGTEKIEEEVRQLFPDLRIARVDTDSTRKKGSLRTILHDFRRGEYDVLLGTQMVAKGLNFPGVRLVGIILADSSLNLPDFRAGERTFALIVQVSGRAGRFLDDGKVVVQTFKPEAPAIKLAVQGDLPAYYEGELSERRELLFPPYYRLFRIVVRGRDRGKVRTVIRDIARDLSFLKHNGAEILGPSECPLETIAKNHRYQLLIRSRFFNRTHRDLRGWFLSYERPSSVFLEIDVDPVSLL